MGLSARLYLIEKDGTILRIPKRVAEGCFTGKDAIPAYAGTRQKILEVIVSSENGKAQAIQHTNGFYLDFDQEGRVYESAMDDLRKVMGHAFPSPPEEGNVVSLSPRRDKQIWEEKSRWKPSPIDLDQIVADLTRKPGAKSLANVVGVAVKRPPLTYEAKSEISEIASKLTMLGWGIGQLSERALPGFIGEARKRAKNEPEQQFYWEATALEAERQLELKRLRRTGKGSWVAVLQLYRHSSPSSSEVAFEEHRSCEGELAAIEAMKELIREHCDKAGSAISVEARTMPALEWQLLNGRPF